LGVKQNKMKNIELDKFGNKIKTLMGLNENKKKVNGFGCVMIYLDFPEFKNLQKEINKDDLYVDPQDDSFGLERGSAHVTLLYGLHEEVTDQQVIDIVSKFDFGEISIKNISLFKNELFEVLKFEVEKEKYLIKCNKELSKLPNTNEFKIFNPHLTLAYLKLGEGDKYIKMFEGLKYDLQPTKIVYSKIDGTEIKIKI